MPTIEDTRLTDLFTRWRSSVEVQLADDTNLHERLFAVWDASDFVAQACVRHPQLLATLHTTGRLDRPSDPGELGDLLQEQLHDVADVAVLEQRLRWFRRNEMVRIIWRDITRVAPLTETLEDLSELADMCVAQALQKLYGWAVSVDGTPLSDNGDPQGLVVLGMGKLGARELNLSSDIDLIFAFPRHGTTDGRRRRTNEEFFTRLGRQLINVLSKKTADGFVFRVDMRLRPFGDAGPLVMSYDAFENYYGSQAREWERYAMVKARIIAGDATHGAEFMAMLRSFVYRRYIDFGSIESMRNMKEMISRELEKKGLSDNIKLGPGGIREIEFIGQVFQLIRGGRDADLQIRPILPVLRLLGDKGLLPGYAVQELAAAYEFLRLVENRLQAWRDEQAHNVPSDEVGRARLARSMGFGSWSQFAIELERHRQRVNGQFMQLFAAPQAAEDASSERMQLVWAAGDAASEAAIEVLREAGLADARQALASVLAFRDSSACRSLSKRGRERLDRLMPLLLDAVCHKEAPSVTLNRLLGLLTAIVRRTAYLDLLVENPLALSQLVRLGAASSWVVDQLTSQPVLLDELLDARRLYTPLRRADLTAELREMLRNVGKEDLEQQMDRLRQFALGNMLRVAAADLTGVIPLRVVSDYLTDIAETVLSSATDIAFDHLTAKHGPPQGVLGGRNGFAIIGYGKLGGIELGYGSDLDLVFLHGSSSSNAMTVGIDGRRSIANSVFYTRMGQRLIHVLTTRTPAGVLYEVDVRLRPNGNAGQLVSSLRAFEHYQMNQAWTWEHQALLRARPICGEPAVIAAFRDVRAKVLAQLRDQQQLRHDVCEMRAKMRAALDQSSSAQFDLKQGKGGIADIEFMVQYHVLLWAHRYPDLLRWTDNLRLLEGLAAHRVLSGEAAELLASIYQVFRATYHRNALQNTPGLVATTQLAEERATICECWASTMADGE